MEPRFVGQMLAVCLSSVLAFSPAAQVTSARVRPPPRQSDSIHVWHLEASQYRMAAELPIVARVRDLLDGALQIRSPSMPNAKTVRRALSERLGTRVTEIASPPHYVWMLIDGEWVLVCLTVTEFRIDFGRWGHVVVETKDEMAVQ